MCKLCAWPRAARTAGQSAASAFALSSTTRAIADFTSFALAGGTDGVDDDVAEKILERMKKMLQLLKYPKNFDTSDWNKLNYFSEACNASTNLQKIRPLLTPERADI